MGNRRRHGQWGAKAGPAAVEEVSPAPDATPRIRSTARLPGPRAGSYAGATDALSSASCIALTPPQGQCVDITTRFGVRPYRLDYVRRVAMARTPGARSIPGETGAHTHFSRPSTGARGRCPGPGAPSPGLPARCADHPCGAGQRGLRSPGRPAPTDPYPRGTHRRGTPLRRPPPMTRRGPLTTDR
ncbi:phosphatase [Streptomyces sp. NPDC000594]|uniref:phosphatase n=1 Tax=Streptomyces sp. NPDC000594 TaxID=3154261 RepID=UPI00332787E4